jgi:hypothetical protein
MVYPGKVWAWTRFGGIWADFFENGYYIFDMPTGSGNIRFNNQTGEAGEVVDLKFTAPGYYHKIVKDVLFFPMSFTHVDVQLKPLPPYEHESRKNVLEFAKTAPDGLKEAILQRVESYDSQKRDAQISQTEPTAPPAPPTDRTDAARRFR